MSFPFGVFPGFRVMGSGRVRSGPSPKVLVVFLVALSVAAYGSIVYNIWSNWPLF